MADHTSAADAARLSARLLSLASHELRTPISVVSGYLRMLQRERDDFTDRQRKMIDEADKACARMVALLGELSDVAKLDDGRTILRTDPIDVFGLVRQGAGEANEASDRGVRLEVRGAAGPATIRGDETHLKAAFAALLRAVPREQADQTLVVVALRHLPDGSPLIVIARDADADRAPGEPEAAFDEMRGGLGLALPVARRVIESHGGRIWSPAGPDGTALARSAILVSLPLGD